MKSIVLKMIFFFLKKNNQKGCEQCANNVATSPQTCEWCENPNLLGDGTCRDASAVACPQEYFFLFFAINFKILFFTK